MSKEFKSFLKFRKEEKCPYPWHLDTYGCGCASNCKFCYAKSLLAFRGHWNINEPTPANLEQIRKTLTKKKDEINIVRMGGMTDCFQPIERELHITRDTVKILNELRIPYLILTKYADVASDEMLSIYDKQLAHFQITITCTDDEFCSTYEGASAPSERIAAVERLAAAGFDVQIRLSPFVVDFVDNGKLDLHKLVHDTKCNKILVEFLRINGWIRKWFGDFVDLERYSLKSRSYNHLPLEEKQKYLDKIKSLSDKQLTVAEYVPEHDEVFRTKYDTNPSDCCNLSW